MRYLIIILIVVYSCLSLAQKWDHVYGNPYWYENPEDNIESYDKGYLILGNTGYNDHGWLIKTDINGNILWDKYFGGVGQDPGFNCLEQDDEGNIYIAGKMKFDNLIPTSIIFKLNNCGELLWCKTFYMENYEDNLIRDIIVYNDSTIFCLAKHNDPNEDKSIYLYSINSTTGNLNWKKPYAINSQYPLLDVSSGYRLYLFNDLLVISGSCYWAYPRSDTIHFYLRPFFVGIDSLFEEKWILPIGVNDSLIGKAWGAIPVSDSVIMGFGKRRFGSFSHSLLMFFDYDGHELGYNIIDNEQLGNDIISNSMNDMRWINDTLLFGSIGYQVDEDYRNFCDVQVDTNGTIHKKEFLDLNAGGGGISNMVKTFDNKYVVTTGYIVDDIGDIYLYKKNSDLEHDTLYLGNYTYDSLCEQPITSGTISLGGCDIITDIKDVPTLEEYNQNKRTLHIKAYPNPVNGNQVTFEFQNTEHLTSPSVPSAGGKLPHLCIYNVFGEKVHEEKVYRFHGESKVDVGDWNSGMYLAIVYSQNKIVGQTKFVVQ